MSEEQEQNLLAENSDRHRVPILVTIKNKFLCCFKNKCCIMNRNREGNQRSIRISHTDINLSYESGNQ